jgi:hypothetical protein
MRGSNSTSIRTTTRAGIPGDRQGLSIFHFGLATRTLDVVRVVVLDEYESFLTRQHNNAIGRLVEAVALVEGD